MSTATRILTLVTCGHLWLVPATAAEETVRFSSGLIHSGSLEIDVDIRGAKSLTLELTAVESGRASARLDWSEAALLDGKNERTALEIPQVAPDGESKRRVRLELPPGGAVRFVAKLRVAQAGAGLTRIQIHHDAPVEASEPSPKKLAKLNADPRRGRGVFFGRGTCASCHVLGGRGVRVGPDLSSLGKRLTLAQIIESITAPSRTIAEGFETNIVETKDGTPHLGFVTDDSSTTISLRDSAGQTHELKKSDLVSRKPQTFSMMPPFGELLTPQQIADLAAFLKAQVEGS